MTDATPTPPDEPTDDPKSIVRRYLSSFAAADPQKIAQFVAEDFVNEHTAGLGTGCQGRSAYEERLVGFLSDMVGLTYEVEQLIGDADQVAAFYQMSATWQGTAPFSLRGVQRLVVEDDLITHRTDYWDSAVFLAKVDPDARQALAAMGITASK